MGEGTEQNVENAADTTARNVHHYEQGQPTVVTATLKVHSTEAYWRIGRVDGAQQPEMLTSSQLRHLPGLSGGVRWGHS